MTTAERPDEDQLDGDRARAIVRAFWLEDIQGLRNRHDQQRRDQNRPPITNKEIAQATGIPQSTLSDLLTNKRNTVPDWDRVCLIIDCLGGTTREWVPKWRAARASFDALGRPGPTPHPQPTADVTGERKQSKWLLGAVAVVLVGATGTGIWMFSPGARTDGPQPAAGVTDARCLQVRDETEDVSVFTGPIGEDKWAEWPGKTRFWSVGETTHPNRWRVPLDNGDYGYVNKNPAYVVTANDCH